MGKMQDEIKGLLRQNRHLENIVQVALDKEYIMSRSLWRDLWILLKTVPAVLTGKGAY